MVRLSLLQKQTLPTTYQYNMIFDIGANLGKWSNANIDITDKIVAVEPQDDIFELLKANCNNKKIVFEKYAICNNDGKDITFYKSNCHVISTINKDWLCSETSRFYNRPYKVITCKTTTIDNLIEKYGVPELIKIDVEGGEYECISSLTRKVDNLCFEWASEVNNITFKCIDYLLTLGFSQFYLQFQDNYTFRPTEYYDSAILIQKLSETTLKKHWGMVWCK